MVFKKTGWPWPLHTVCHQRSTRNISQRLREAFEVGFDSIVVKLFSDEYLNQQFERKGKLHLDESTIPSDQHFDARQYTRNVMMELNEQLVENLEVEQWRNYLEFVIGYAAYLGVYAIVVNVPRVGQKQFAALLDSYFEKGRLGNVRLIVRVLYEASERHSQQWNHYILLRQLLTSKLNVDLMLVLAADMPADMELHRWIGEHIDYVGISADCFTTNSKGHPVLASKHAGVLKQLLWQRATVCIEQTHPQQLVQPFLKFVQFVFEKLKEPSVNQLQSIRYADILQEPLQPYYDNLESQTYSVFEQDNAKYDQYEMALQRALLVFPADHRVVIFYIGCGRGQLIYSCVNASKKTNRNIVVYAIEKNPYPIQTLKRRIAKNKWVNLVHIVESDVRDWQPEMQADIFLSELLGGFGDNQLSPQCLSWAEKHLQKHTICIPKSYSAWCSPVSCSWLYRKMNSEERQKYFVVRLSSIYRPSDVQQLWSFEHPLDKTENFERYAECKFTIQQKAVLHGFAGYFECQLYEGCKLSTNPESHTPDMYSWYPMLFSFNEPLEAEQHNKLIVRVWRKCQSDRVWYEWQADLLDSLDSLLKSTKLHNEQGSKLSIMM